MAEANGQEKTEKPTGKRRRDARKDGNLFQSKDAVTVVMLFGVFYMVRLTIPSMYRTLRDCMVRYFSMVGNYDPFGESPNIYIYMVTALLKCSIPLLAASLVLGILSHGIQTRFNLTFKPLRPKFSKLNPITGLKRLFGIKKLVDLAKNLIKIALLLALLYNLLKEDLIQISRMFDMQIMVSTSIMLKLVFDLVLRVCLAFAIVAFFDYLYQRWDYENNLKMTKQEVKDEYKNTEGNPEIKGRIRSVQRQMAMSRMMQKVPQADVIIRNPTHFAVALRYNPEKDSAPVVLAKGQDSLALRIVRVGEEHGVFVIENRPLARALYASSEIDREIPAEFYGAVAEILVYIYKASNRQDMFDK
ncbi:MAG: flagellar biosynthesis protein FlhB [Lachnospiraceae bacterium]|nr:flagellar biosynthesis protein FlhB [Lachnospiraceae bacterium]